LGLCDLLNTSLFMQKIKELTILRKHRHKYNNFIVQVVECVTDHINSKNPLSHEFIIFLMSHLMTFKDTNYSLILKNKADIIFSIQKS